MIMTLNYQYGSMSRVVRGPPSRSQSLAIGLLGQAADILLERNEVTVNSKDWAAELRMRKIGYAGEEVGLPLVLTWAQVEPGLPDIGVAASLEATRFATGEVRRVLLDPDRLLLPECEWEEAPRRCRIWCDSDAEFEELAAGLVERGILEEVDEDIAEATVLRDSLGRPLLAGMFGVEKPKDEPVLRDGVPWPVLRLIFYLVPPNATLKDFDADIRDLPSQGQFGALALLDREIFLIGSRDRQCFFYVWRVPLSWRKLLFVNRVVVRDGRRKRLALTVVGMGLKPAVTITQHLHRNILRAGASRGMNISLDSEIRRQRPFPISARSDQRSAWLVYVDDLKLAEIVDVNEARVLQALEGLHARGRGEVYGSWYPGQA